MSDQSAGAAVLEDFLRDPEFPCQAAFRRIKAEKQKRVLTEVLQEFAREGYARANVNRMAEAAEISVGSLYLYFASKDDLFRAVLRLGCRYFSQAVREIDREEDDLEAFLRRLFRVTIHYCARHPDLLRIYLDMGRERIDLEGEKLMDELEADFQGLYGRTLKRASARGELRTGIPLSDLALLLDNALVMFQVSMVSAYMGERFAFYLHDAGSLEERAERLVQTLLSLLRP